MLSLLLNPKARKYDHERWWRFSGFTFRSFVVATVHASAVSAIISAILLFPEHWKMWLILLGGAATVLPALAYWQGGPKLTPKRLVKGFYAPTLLALVVLGPAKLSGMLGPVVSWVSPAW